MNTQHAHVRSQQRGVPRLIQDWLLDYGEEKYDGHGGILRFFSKHSLRRMERDMGKAPLKRLSEYFRCYLVESHDGKIITVGKRYKHQKTWKH